MVCALPPPRMLITTALKVSLRWCWGCHICMCRRSWVGSPTVLHLSCITDSACKGLWWSYCNDHLPPSPPLYSVEIIIADSGHQVMHCIRTSLTVPYHDMFCIWGASDTPWLQNFTFVRLAWTTADKVVLLMCPVWLSEAYTESLGCPCGEESPWLNTTQWPLKGRYESCHHQAWRRAFTLKTYQRLITWTATQTAQHKTPIDGDSHTANLLILLTQDLCWGISEEVISTSPAPFSTEHPPQAIDM